MSGHQEQQDQCQSGARVWDLCCCHFLGWTKCEAGGQGDGKHGSSFWAGAPGDRLLLPCHVLERVLGLAWILVGFGIFQGTCRLFVASPGENHPRWDTSDHQQQVTPGSKICLQSPKQLPNKWFYQLRAPTFCQNLGRIKQKSITCPLFSVSLQSADPLNTYPQNVSLGKRWPSDQPRAHSPPAWCPGVLTVHAAVSCCLLLSHQPSRDTVGF